MITSMRRQPTIYQRSVGIVFGIIIALVLFGAFISMPQPFTGMVLGRSSGPLGQGMVYVVVMRTDDGRVQLVETTQSQYDRAVRGERMTIWR